MMALAAPASKPSAQEPRGTDLVLGVDSFSILFNHRSFQKPAVFPADGFLERRIPGKNGGVFSRLVAADPSAKSEQLVWGFSGKPLDIQKS